MELYALDKMKPLHELRHAENALMPHKRLRFLYLAITFVAVTLPLDSVEELMARPPKRAK